jgi:hypothetical protein
MKNSKVFFTAFVLFLSLAFTRCTPDTTGLVPSTEEILIRNAWAVDYYFHNQDMTSDFGSSRILFSSTGTVGYQRNGETIPGTWVKTIDASNNELITLHFNTADANVNRLNESWKLTDKGISSLQFEENNGTTNILFRIKTQ